MSHATHSNAALTPRARLRLARLVVDHGWPPARAAERYDVSWRRAKKGVDLYRAEGTAGMADRSSLPRRHPNRTPAPVVRKIVHLRWKRRLGQVEIADLLTMHSSTVHAFLGAAGSTGSPTSTIRPAWATRCSRTPRPSSTHTCRPRSWCSPWRQWPCTTSSVWWSPAALSPGRRGQRRTAAATRSKSRAGTHSQRWRWPAAPHRRRPAAAGSRSPPR